MKQPSLSFFRSQIRGGFLGNGLGYEVIERFVLRCACYPVTRQDKTCTFGIGPFGEMLKTPSQITLQTYRVNDKDLTEIELHSVDSINDLHRTYPEHNHKGPRPPRPAFPPSLNGTLHTHHMKCVSGASKLQSRVRDTLIPNTSQAYATACALITLLLLTLVLIFYFLVQQGSALQRLTEALREKEAEATQLSALIQQLQALTLNITATRGRT